MLRIQHFYDKLYASSNSNRKDRWGWYTSGLGLPLSTLGTVEHGLHRRRRAAMSPYFSKQTVRRLEPLIIEGARKLTARFEKLASTGEVVLINHAFSAFTNDMAMEYCFGFSDQRIDAENFDPTFHHSSFTAGTLGNAMRNLPWVMKTTMALPEKIAIALSEDFSSFITLVSERKQQIEKIRKEMKEKKTFEEPATIFHGLLASDLPEGEKDSRRLAEEAVLLIGAATHTTAWALSVATFHLLSQKHTLANLRAELEAAIPAPYEPTTLATIEQLPYLTAVIKKGLRLSFGNTSRIPRIAKDIPMDFHGTKIPLGVPVSMAIPEVHLDEKIFPDPYAFHPERWLEDKTGHLERYLVPFTRGPRACLGLNLAWAELYICLSTVFRRFGTEAVKRNFDFGVMNLYDTDAGDVALVRDALFAMPKDGSKGVRVKLNNAATSVTAPL